MLAKGKDGGSGHCGFLDRSKVRILLCDNDAKSSEEILYLLAKCSYQVTLVRTARQVVDVLNAQGPDIDIILTEVDLPTTKGLKMLKYITRNVELRRIPIIMMSSQDEVSVVVKCLRLGAADYLVKPLRTNELLNLWTHMWRRRRMLGLMEKSMLSNDFDLLVSDHSDANTNSATLFSDDSDDKLIKAVNPEPTISNHQIYESNAPCTESQQNNAEANQHSTAENADRSGILSRPKKMDLRIGESSAFLTYVRSSVPTGRSQVKISGGDQARSQDVSAEEKHFAECDTDRCPSTEIVVSHSIGTFCYAGDRTSDTNPIPPSLKAPVECASTTRQLPSRKEDQVEGSKVPLVFPMPMYFTGSAEQSMTPSTFQMYQVNLNNVHMHSTPPMVSQYNMLSQCPHLPMMMPSYPYYPVPVGINLPAVHVPGQQQHLRSSTSSSSTPDAKSGQMERREAALIKFRQKRKERCFDKKIRYVNRKKLAERRPRIRGQFVRHADGLDAHPNANDEWDEDEEEEHTPRELELDSSPEPSNSEY